MPRLRWRGLPVVQTREARPPATTRRGEANIGAPTNRQARMRTLRERRRCGDLGTSRGWPGVTPAAILTTVSLWRAVAFLADIGQASLIGCIPKGSSTP
jgi:hypothetical protein